MSGLPDGWEWRTLGDLLVGQRDRDKLQQGWSPRCHAHPADHEHWGVLKTTAAQPGWFDDTQNKQLPDHLEPRPALEVQPGDVLITSAGPRSRCGVPALVRSTRSRLMLSGKFYRFRPTREIDPAFLESWLLSPTAQHRIDAMKTGISESGLNLTQSRFLSLAVPVPPLDEQHRIVAILEDHLAHLDAANSALSAALVKAASLMESTISEMLSTMSSDLVPLGSILAERLVNGKSVPTQDNGFPVLRLTALKESTVDLAERKEGAWTAEEAASFLVREGDIMVARGNGSLNLVARGALVRSDPDPVAFPDTMIRVRPQSEAMLPSYLIAVWNSRFVRRQVERVARTTAGIYKVNQKMLEHILVPSVPISAQAVAEKSIAEVGEAQERVVAHVTVVRMKTQALRRSLLAAAFRGDLTVDYREKV